MQQLLEIYSISDIALFLVMFSLAVKGVITFIDWAYARLKKVFDKAHDEEEQKERVEIQLKRGFDIMDELGKHQDSSTAQLEKLSQKVDLLIDSDKDDIKAFLTKEHHYHCYQLGWVDDYSLECCERRFAHYQQEGGNSFIEGFMEDLRHLPKQTPNQTYPEIDK